MCLLYYLFSLNEGLVGKRVDMCIFRYFYWIFGELSLNLRQDLNIETFTN